jgi:para-aminobenzoate synthetase component I
MSDFVPAIEELASMPAAEELFLRLAVLPHCLFLDSARPDPRLGRYSFLAADPFDYFEASVECGDCLGAWARRMAGLRAATVAGLPPFQGGAAGLLAYDLGRQIEALPPPRADEFRLPALAMGFYDVVVALDHVERRGWVISQGLPEVEPDKRRRRAESRLREALGWLAGPPRSLRHRSPPPIPSNELAAQYPVTNAESLTSDFSEREYLKTVRQAIDYIEAGDIFQVNLAQRLLHPARDDSVTLYQRLRQCNPAPFAGYFDLGDFQIASASPERFLKVVDRNVETRPIKGTRPRSAEPQRDQAAAAELCRSGKDRAENVMIVDLLRNDLARVCEPPSVRVDDLCRLESYEHVHHLVSSVRGRLREPCNPIDLIRAAFPGGSITGAPKVRAMEIIAELEPVARGAYCGSLGYLGFDGTMDLNILIRTITAGRGWWQASVGGGIVAESTPEREYEETWHKAEGLIRAMK